MHNAHFIFNLSKLKHLLIEDHGCQNKRKRSNKIKPWLPNLSVTSDKFIALKSNKIGYKCRLKDKNSSKKMLGVKFNISLLNYNKD